MKYIALIFLGFAAAFGLSFLLDLPLFSENWIRKFFVIFIIFFIQILIWAWVIIALKKEKKQ
tara:strand:+ start:4017 stop:4202 length:186 start_codon:yes stop_codon:yes gene_type:complete